MESYFKAMWVFDWKADARGCPTKAKARLVARVDENRISIDFGGLFAPTVAVSSVRWLTPMNGVRTGSWLLPL